MDSESPNQANEPQDSSEANDPIVVASYADEQPAEDEVQLVKEDLLDEGQPIEADQQNEYAGNTFVASRQLPVQFQNVSARGGAVAAIVLGCLAVFGAFVTQWSLFNAIIGLPLGLWGLTSNFTRTSAAGIGLCVIGFILCFAMYAG